MNPVNQLLDRLEALIGEEPPDLPKVQALIASIREELARQSTSWQQLIESNAALATRCVELQDAAKNR